MACLTSVASLWYFRHLFETVTDQFRICCTVFVNESKAHIIIHICTSVSIISWITSFYGHCTVCVCISGYISDRTSKLRNADSLTRDNYEEELNDLIKTSTPLNTASVKDCLQGDGLGFYIPELSGWVSVSAMTSFVRLLMLMWTLTSLEIIAWCFQSRIRSSSLVSGCRVLQLLSENVKILTL